MTRAHLACPLPPPQLLNMKILSLSPWWRPEDSRRPPAHCFFTHRISGKRIFACVFVQNAALAEALASFSGFRSFRIVLPLQRWRHFQCHATACNAMLCCVPLRDAMPSAAML